MGLPFFITGGHEVLKCPKNERSCLQLLLFLRPNPLVFFPEMERYSSSQHSEVSNAAHWV